MELELKPTGLKVGVVGQSVRSQRNGTEHDGASPCSKRSCLPRQTWRGYLQVCLSFHQLLAPLPFAAVPGHLAERSSFLIRVLLGARPGLSSACCHRACRQRRSCLCRPRGAGASRCSPTDGLHFNSDGCLRGPMSAAAACSHLCNKPLSLLLPWVLPHGAVGPRAVIPGSAWLWSCLLLPFLVAKSPFTLR